MLTCPLSPSWGNRRANGYQALAEDGYALLAERLRSEDERAVVRNVLERVLHVKLDMAAVYAADAAAAQDALKAALSKGAASEETVRSGELVCLALSSVCAGRAPLCTARMRCDLRVSITTCGGFRNKYKAEITEADSLADGGGDIMRGPAPSATDANTMLILSK